MANLHLVTGYAGKEHITSSDQGSFNAAVMGTGEFVLERGKQFEAQVISNNTVRVFDGDLLMQGRHIRLKENTYVDLFFENGMQGYKRVDLIVARYEKDAVSDVENANLVVIKGVPAEDSYSVPEKITGDIINDHALQNDTVLYQVKFDGLGIQEPEKVFSTVSTIETEIENMKNKALEDIEKYIQEKIKIVDDKLKIVNFDSPGIVDKAFPPDKPGLYDGYPLERTYTWQQVPTLEAKPAWYPDWRQESTIAISGELTKGKVMRPRYMICDPYIFEALFEFIDLDNYERKSTVHLVTYDTTRLYRRMQYYGTYGKKAGYNPDHIFDCRKITVSFSLYYEDTYAKIGDFTVIFHFEVDENYSIYVVVDDVKSNGVTLGMRKYLSMDLGGTGTCKFS